MYIIVSNDSEMKDKAQLESKAKNENLRHFKENWATPKNGDPKTGSDDNNNNKIITFAGHGFLPEDKNTKPYYGGDVMGQERGYTPEKFYEELRKKRENGQIPDSVESFEFGGCDIGLIKPPRASWLQEFSYYIACDPLFDNIKSVRGFMYKDEKDEYLHMFSRRDSKDPIEVILFNKENYDGFKKYQREFDEFKKNLDSMKDLKLKIENLEKDKDAEKSTIEPLKIELDKLIKEKGNEKELNSKLNSTLIQREKFIALLPSAKKNQSNNEIYIRDFLKKENNPLELTKYREDTLKNDKLRQKNVFLHDNDILIKKYKKEILEAEKKLKNKNDEYDQNPLCAKFQKLLKECGILEAKIKKINLQKSIYAGQKRITELDAKNMLEPINKEITELENSFMLELPEDSPYRGNKNIRNIDFLYEERKKFEQQNQATIKDIEENIEKEKRKFAEFLNAFSEEQYALLRKEGIVSRTMESELFMFRQKLQEEKNKGLIQPKVKNNIIQENGDYIISKENSIDVQKKEKKEILNKENPEDDIVIVGKIPQSQSVTQHKKEERSPNKIHNNKNRKKLTESSNNEEDVIIIKKSFQLEEKKETKSLNKKYGNKKKDKESIESSSESSSEIKKKKQKLKRKRISSVKKKKNKENTKDKKIDKKNFEFLCLIEKIEYETNKESKYEEKRLSKNESPRKIFHYIQEEEKKSDFESDKKVIQEVKEDVQVDQSEDQIDNSYRNYNYPGLNS